MSLTYHNYVCECGCGELVLPESRFVNGHWINICNPMKDLEIAQKSGNTKRGKSVISIRGDNHPLRKNPELAKKIGLKLRGRIFPHMLGENNPMKNPDIAKRCADSKRGKSNTAILGDKHPLKNPIHLVKIQGENNHNWKGGNSTPYHINFTYLFKESIRIRDNRICQICGKTEEENGKRLEVHHINYDPENDCSNDEDFISLCHSCHIQTTNGDREEWQSILKEKINKVI